MNSLWFASVFCLLCITATGQESVEFPPLHGSAGAAQVENEHLKSVSQSVLTAETWVKTNVLAHYPGTNITTILVGHNVLCNQNEHHHNWGFILPSIKNIHYVLTRWGLQNHIKVSTPISSTCLDSETNSYIANVAQTHIKPLLNTLQEINSPYVVNILPSQTPRLALQTHLESMRKLGDFQLDILTNTLNTQQPSPTSRKLSFFSLTKTRDPFPPRPTPALPPLIGTIPPAFAPLIGSPNPNPVLSPPFLPPLAPMANPASPPFGPHLPPCDPSPSGPAPVGAVHHGLWCVAKPSVPPETLQEALDFACGDGDADCEAIQPAGSCYLPDSLVAHASYAFNSYWQKTKNSGGTCGFGGTAMLVNSDPSYRHCRFVLT